MYAKLISLNTRAGLSAGTSTFSSQWQGWIHRTVKDLAGLSALNAWLLLPKRAIGQAWESHGSHLRGGDTERGRGGEMGSIASGANWTLESSRAGFGPLDMGPGMPGTIAASPEVTEGRPPPTGAKLQTITHPCWWRVSTEYNSVRVPATFSNLTTSSNQPPDLKMFNTEIC